MPDGFIVLICIIASGFSRSASNMAIFFITLLGPKSEGISITGAAHDLLWVALGNTVGCTIRGSLVALCSKTRATAQFLILKVGMLPLIHL